MPNRILRDWTDSDAINKLVWRDEVLFCRLMMKADDFGRFTANPKLISSLCFPLKDGIREADIIRSLDALRVAELIALYQAADKPLLQIRKFGQRVRKGCRSKYPDRDGNITVADRDYPVGLEDDNADSSDPQTDAGNDGAPLAMTALFGGVCGGGGEVDSPKPPKGAGKEESLRLRIGGWFKRRPTTPWTPKEEKALASIGETEDDDLAALEAYYTAKIDKDDWRRRDILTLLNNWPGEIDRARAFVNSPDFKRNRPVAASKAVPAWEDELQSIQSTFEAFQNFPKTKKPEIVEGLRQKIKALPKEAWDAASPDLRRQMEELTK